MYRTLLVLCALTMMVAVAPANAATLSATPSTFAQVFADAQPGDTILLASGDYGTFTGGMKSGEVTIKEADGASATMALDFTPASYITLEGIKHGHSEISGLSTHHITIRNADFNGAQLVLRTSNLANASILLDGNRHTNWTQGPGVGDGRIYLPGRVEDQPSGITIQNSYFSGGEADGILNGSNGTRIIANEFAHLKEGASNAHTDSIQLYGSKNTLIKGNYFHDVEVGIMAADGADHEVIEDNVIEGAGLSAFKIHLFSDDGSILRHNTVVDGIIYYGKKSSCPYPSECDESRGTVIKDNIAREVSLSNNQVPAEQGYNLLAQGYKTSTDILGVPVYVGGATPTTYEGHKLADDSLGQDNASDGLDRGVRFATSEPTPEPEPTLAQCEDGQDNDGDLLIDWPDDPGCTDSADTDETDPTPEPEPEPEPSPEYNPDCAPDCDEVIASLTDQLDRIHVISDKDVWGVSKHELRERLLKVREIVHE